MHKYKSEPQNAFVKMTEKISHFIWIGRSYAQVFPILNIFLYSVFGLLAAFMQPKLSFAEENVRIAVLDFRNQEKIDRASSTYLAELFRKQALMLKSRGVTIMTRENMLELLPSGKSLEQCLGECEVETGRNLGANYIVTGEIYKIGDGIRLIVKAYDTKKGSLISSEQYSGNSVQDLEKNVLSPDAPNVFLPISLIYRKAKTTKDQVLGKEREDGWDPGWGTEQTVVEFESTPAGATVEIDGSPICVTPCSNQITLGRHTVSFKIIQYFPLEEELDIKKNLRLKRKLSPNFATVSVNSSPIGLMVFIDDKEMGKTPTKVMRLSPEMHEIFIKDDKYYDKGYRLTVKPGDHKEINLEPVGRYGALNLSAKSESGKSLAAEVLIDGESAGTTPLRKKLLVGQHEVEVHASGDAEWKGDVKISEHKVENLIITAKKVERGVPFSALAYDHTGCGHLIAADKRDVYSLTASVLTVSLLYPLGIMTSTTQGLAITNGTSGCKPSEEKKVADQLEFIDVSSRRLALESARGEGPILRTYHEILGCRLDSYDAFRNLMKENYKNIFYNTKTSQSLFTKTQELMFTDAKLSSSCSINKFRI